MTKPWKFKQGANTKKSGSMNRCDMHQCPHNEVYSGCALLRNWRNCKDRHVRPKK